MYIAVADIRHKPVAQTSQTVPAKPLCDVNAMTIIIIIFIMRTHVRSKINVIMYKYV